jgi:hypothetical protein
MLVPFLELCVFFRVRVLLWCAPARGGVTFWGVVVTILEGLRPASAKYKSGAANPDGSEHSRRIGRGRLVCKGLCWDAGVAL